MIATISIIVPTWNGGETPLHFVRSVKKQTLRPEEIEVIVVDNGSRDGTPERISEAFPEVTLIRRTTNEGFAKAVNLAAQSAHGEFLFITNDDVTLEPDCLRFLLETIRTSPTIGAVGGRVYEAGAGSDGPFVSGYRYHLISGRIETIRNRTGPLEVEWIQACGMLLSRETFLKLGGFDERFSPAYFEDLDLCTRLRKADYRLRYDPRSKLWHGGSRTSDRDLRVKTEAWYLNKLRFLFRWGSPLIVGVSLLWQLLSLPFLAISSHFVNALKKRSGTFRPFFLALSKVWAERRSIAE